MLVSCLLFVLGLVLLIFGGDFFVDASTNIAKKLHIPDLLIGATIVSIGTTLPEVMVSATGALEGHSQIAYGNAIGSIICNTALICAITIAFKPNKVSKKTLYLPVSFFFVAAIFYVFCAINDGYFSRLEGIFLLCMFVAYMILQVIDAKKTAVNEKSEEESSTEGKTSKDILFLILGAAAIALGARLLVDNGTIIAKEFGVPESVIALTFVALGTSLPELVTAITSLVKGHGLLSLGNIIGANLFNLVLVSGTAITLCPFKVPTEKTIMGLNASFVVDIPLMLTVMLILTLPPLIKGKLYRWQGILLLALYAGYCFFQFAL